MIGRLYDDVVLTVQKSNVKLGEMVDKRIDEVTLKLVGHDRPPSNTYWLFIITFSYQFKYYC